MPTPVCRGLMFSLAPDDSSQPALEMSNRPDEKATRASDGRGRLLAPALVFGIFGVCLVRLVGFVHDNAVDVLYNDQWDTLRTLFEGRGPGSAFFLQHGPPRLGLGGLINWYLYNATQWNVRAEAWAGVVVLGLATLVAIALAVRLRGRLAWTDAAFPLLLLSPVHWETLTFTTFLGAQILPLLLTLLLAYAWGATSRITQILGVGLFGPLVLFTGYGFCGAPVTIGLAMLLWLRPDRETARADRRSAMLILLLMGAAMALFAHEYHWSPGKEDWRFPVTNWWDYPRFCALMFTNLLGWRAISVTSVTAGAVLLGLVAAAFLRATMRIWRRHATPRARVVWILTGTSLGYAMLTALGRLPTNLEAAFMWRYITLMMPALCGLALAVEGWTSARGPKGRLGFGVGWLALAGVVWSNFTPENYAATVARGKRLWVASYLETHDLDAANKAADFVVYVPEPASPRIAEKLRWLEQHHLSFFRTSPDQK